MSSPAARLRDMLDHLHRSDAQLWRMQTHLTPAEWLERLEVTVRTLTLTNEMLILGQLIQMDPTEANFADILRIQADVEAQMGRLHAQDERLRDILRRDKEAHSNEPTE